LFFRKGIEKSGTSIKFLKMSSILMRIDRSYVNDCHPFPAQSDCLLVTANNDKYIVSDDSL
jgi:hypothetical protein